MPSITTATLQAELRERRAALYKKTDEIDEEIAKLDEALDLITEAATLLAVRSVVEPPVETVDEPKLPDERRLVRRIVSSQSYPWVKTYDVTVSTCNNLLVYRCTCPAFTFTKPYEDGTKAFCKHIRTEIYGGHSLHEAARSALANA